MGGTSAFTTALTTNVILAAGLFVVFCFLRSRKQNEWLYMARYRNDRFVRPNQRNGWVPPPLLPAGYLSWILATLRVPDEVFYESAGLDALMQLLFMQLFCKLFAFCSAIGLLVLMPIYSELGDNLIENADGFASAPEGIDRISLTNVEEGSHVLWATFLAGIAFTVYACILFTELYKRWVVYRHRHLAENAKKGFGMSVLVQDLPKELRLDGELAKFYESIFKDKFESCVVARDLTALVKHRSDIDKYEWKRELARGKWQKSQDKFKAGKSKKAERPTHRTTPVVGKKVDSIDWFTSEIERLEQEIEKGKHEDLPPLSSGIVTFNSAVATLSCESIADSGFTMEAEMLHRFAPEPRDVYWPSLKLDRRQRTARKLAMATATFWLVIFWLIPVIFVSSLTTLTALSEAAPWLNPIISASPAITGFLEGFLPSLALVLFNILLPKILIVFSKIEGVASHSWIQMSLFNRFFTFLVVNNFLAVTLAGAMMDQIDAFIASPTSIIELLGNAVPKAATFFTTYVMVMSFAGYPLKLINPGGLIIGTAMKKTLATSDAQKDRVEVPVYEKYGITYSLHIFVVLIGYAYAPISPIITPFATIYFAFGYLTVKYKSLYCIVPTDEGGGEFWPVLFAKIRVVMLVAQITLAGCLGLKKQAIISPIAILLPIVTWFYTGSLSESYNVRGKFLTAQKAAQLDDGIEPDADPLDVEIGPDGKYRLSQGNVQTDGANADPSGDVSVPDTPPEPVDGKKGLTKKLSGVVGGITSAFKKARTGDEIAADAEGKVPAPDDAYGRQLDQLVNAKPGSTAKGAVHGSFGFAAGGRLAASRAADEIIGVVGTQAVQFVPPKMLCETEI